MARVVSGSFVHIEGLAEFRDGLRHYGRKYPLALTAANRKVAKEVGTAARSKAQSLGSVAAKTAPAVGWKASGTLASVTLDGVKAPYAFGAEFGALQYPQFKPWKGNGPEAGYFLYPTIREKSEGGFIKDTYLDLMVDELAKRAFPIP